MSNDRADLASRLIRAQPAEVFAAFLGRGGGRGVAAADLHDGADRGVRAVGGRGVPDDADPRARGRRPAWEDDGAFGHRGRALPGDRARQQDRAGVQVRIRRSGVRRHAADDLDAAADRQRDRGDGAGRGRAEGHPSGGSPRRTERVVGQPRGSSSSEHEVTLRAWREGRAPNAAAPRRAGTASKPLRAGRGAARSPRSPC